jgi:DNA (cytosine-5)-methyltransferase 1
MGAERGGKHASARPLVAVDLFSGAGGLSLGLQQAGFRIVSAVERDPQAAETYEANHDGVAVLVKDAANVSGTDLLGRRKFVDLVAAGPPCTGFSMKGPRRSDHPGNPMLQEVVRLVGELKPKAALIENVVGLTSLDRGFYFDRLVTGLERIDLGDGTRYDVSYSVLNAAEFGAPQTRRRLFIVAIEPRRRWGWPTPTSDIGDFTPQCQAEPVCSSPPQWHQHRSQPPHQALGRDAPEAVAGPEARPEREPLTR